MERGDMLYLLGAALVFCSTFVPDNESTAGVYMPAVVTTMVCGALVMLAGFVRRRMTCEVYRPLDHYGDYAGIDFKHRELTDD